ncbi:MAG: imidazolonepropionase [Bdellovibrio sp.]
MTKASASSAAKNRAAKNRAAKNRFEQKLTLFHGIKELVTMAGVAQKQGRSIQDADVGLINNGALLIQGGRLVWAGAESKIPRELQKRIRKKIDLKAAAVVPGFVECHTHLVFAGERASEFEERNRGVSYQEISARGGGILATMKATRSASKAALLKLAQLRADRFMGQGVTTLEVKTGYALNEKDELKTLQVQQAIQGPRIISTFLGAHALPPEFKTPAAYLQFLTTLLPKIKKKKLAQRVDIFIEKGFFTAEMAAPFLAKAQALGFDLTIHADQLSLSGGTSLAVELGACSADHVIQLDPKQIQNLAQSSTTAVCLPAADLYMRCAYPPARALLDAGGRVALATDFNPGTSPTQDLSLVGLLARLEMKMTLPEVWAALTYNAACALKLQAEIGSLEAGKFADFVVLAEDWRSLFYSIGHHPVTSVWREGRLICGASGIH